MARAVSEKAATDHKWESMNYYRTGLRLNIKVRIIILNDVNTKLKDSPSFNKKVDIFMTKNSSNLKAVDHTLKSHREDRGKMEELLHP